MRLRLYAGALYGYRLACVRVLNQKAAQQSLVLLKNPSMYHSGSSVLPVSPGKHTIAVVGPHANATNSLIQVRVRPSPVVASRTDRDRRQTTRSNGFDAHSFRIDRIRV